MEWYLPVIWAGLIGTAVMHQVGDLIARHAFGGDAHPPCHRTLVDPRPLQRPMTGRLHPAGAYRFHPTHGRERTPTRRRACAPTGWLPVSAGSVKRRPAPISESQP